MASALHMIQLVLDARGLWRGAERHGLPKSTTDLGYLVHAHLAALFGDLAPKPFRIHDRGAHGVELMGYTEHDGGALRSHAEAFAKPLDWQVCQDLASKPMPASWQAGRQLGFEVLVCPVARMAKESEHHRAKAERDVYLQALSDHTEETLDRQQVYLDWLGERLGERGARLLRGELTRFELTTLHRKKQGNGRPVKPSQKPKALLQGVLEVTDGEAFAELLSRGVGRHRAFGFGMVLLRPC